MIDNRFYNEANPLSVADIVELIGAEKHRGSNSFMARTVASSEHVEPGGLCFAHNKIAASSVRDEKGIICLVTPDLVDQLGSNITAIVTPEPKRAFGVVMKVMYGGDDLHPQIDENASVANSATIGDGCRVEAGVYIGENVEIGANCHLKSGVHIGKGCVIGAECVIEANATITHALIGDNNHIGPNANIGFTGFGVGNDSGNMIIPHIGRVIIGNHCHFGASSCIDRGFIDDTIIGDHVMCDNLVQIGHNCKIGNGNIICGQVGISGSVTIGENNIFGGNAGVADHVTIGSDNIFVARAGVTKSIENGHIMAGFPAIPVQDHRREVATLRRLAARKKTST